MNNSRPRARGRFNCSAVLTLKVLNTLRRGFAEFTDAILKSGQPSVDPFLQRRSEFLGVGKVAIAFCPDAFSREEKLYHPDPHRGGDWYEYLSVKLNSSFEEFGENKLSIITFNYDCSLEHYLLNSLINSHEKTVMNAQRRSRKFRSFTFIASSASGRIAADRLCWK